MIKFLFVFVLFLSIFNISLLLSAPQPINDLEKAFREAKQQQKMIFIKYGREQCGNCQALKKLINTGKVFISEKDFIFADINCDDDTQDKIFCAKFPIGGGTLPFVVITDSEGKMLVSRKGYGEEKDFNKLIEQAKIKFKDIYSAK